MGPQLGHTTPCRPCLQKNYSTFGYSGCNRIFVEENISTQGFCYKTLAWELVAAVLDKGKAMQVAQQLVRSRNCQPFSQWAVWVCPQATGYAHRNAGPNTVLCMAVLTSPDLWMADCLMKKGLVAGVTALPSMLEVCHCLSSTTISWIWGCLISFLPSF